MVTVTARLRLEVPGVTSLKEKRRILKSLITRLRNDFNISLAEVGLQDVLRQAELGAAVVANDVSFCHKVMDSVVRRVESNPETLLGQVIVEEY